VMAVDHARSVDSSHADSYVASSGNATDSLGYSTDYLLFIYFYY